MFRSTILALALVGLALPASAIEERKHAGLDPLISAHAKANDVPESLVHRIIVRESRYNPGAVGRGGAMGLMQIKTATARGVGYDGGPSGLLNAETNLKYAVRYLAGAWRLAGGSHDRAVSLYARGYYYEAKRRGLAPGRARAETTVAAVADPTARSETPAVDRALEATALAAERPELTVDSVLRGMDR